MTRIDEINEQLNKLYDEVYKTDLEWDNVVRDAYHRDLTAKREEFKLRGDTLHNMIVDLKKEKRELERK